MKWTDNQLSAINKSGTNIIVSAGAGSGKTAVLSERVLKKLEDGIHINELLILTFTSAAAGEMKNRIRKKISKKSEFKEELNRLSSSYITTFDSYALSVLKKYHYLLNLPKDISITDESIIKLEEIKIIDEIFEELYSENNIEFESLVNDYCVKNDKVLRNSILSLALSVNNNIFYSDFLNKIKNEFFTDKNIDELINEFIDLVNEKRNTLKLEINNMSCYFDSKYMDKVMTNLDGILNCDINDLHLYSSACLPRVNRYSSEEAKSSKEEVKSLLDELVYYTNYKISEIKDNILSSKSNIMVIVGIIEKFINRLNEYKTKNNIYTFIDISKLSIKLLRENESVRNEIRDSFKEIMIDEYQDTNDVQDIFISMIENNNVYMVGDIKQSIYKFRGSNPNIFKNKYDLYSKGNSGYKIDLVENFRSRSEVLNNINNIFELLMDDEIGGASYRISHEMIYGNKTYDEKVCNDTNYDIDILEYDNNTDNYKNIEIEIFTIANDIKNKMSYLEVFDKDTSEMRKSTYNDFVIILDRSKYFNDFKKVFEYMGIPLTILKDDVLNTNEDILLIKNIFDFINRINNNDYGINFKYDFISIARSFLYEYTDGEIFEIFKNNSFKETSIYKELSSINSIQTKVISDIFISILDITKFYEKLSKIGDYESINIRLNTLYSMSLNLNNLGYGISEFIDYLDKLLEEGIDIKYSTSSDNLNSVKIMTIHKSKGLEYPICYFADLDHKFNVSELNSSFIVSNKYGFILKSENNILKELYKSDFIKEEISEKIRLFYVALTRAREKMIIVLPYKETKRLECDSNSVIDRLRRLRFSKLSDFIYGIKDYYNTYFSSVDLNKINLTKKYLLKKKIISEIESNEKDIVVKEIDSDSSIISESHYSKELNKRISYNDYKLLNYGTLVHETLELLDFNNLNLDIIKDNFIKEKIINLLKNDIFKNIKNAKIYKEYEFIYNDNNSLNKGIIDLMIEYDNYIDIIDYKLKNIEDDNYKKQLNGYKDYISKKTNKKINVYLYSIIDEVLLRV